VGAVMITPCAPCSHLGKLIVRIEPVSACRKTRGKSALPRGILCYARRTIAPVRPASLRVRLCLQSVRLNPLLPVKCTLLACVADFLAALCALRGWEMTQFTIFTPTQAPFRAQLLTGIELRLFRCLHV
jgi:hypothetical protein